MLEPRPKRERKAQSSSLRKNFLVARSVQQQGGLPGQGAGHMFLYTGRVLTWRNGQLREC